MHAYIFTSSVKFSEIDLDLSKLFEETIFGFELNLLNCFNIILKYIATHKEWLNTDDPKACRIGRICSLLKIIVFQCYIWMNWQWIKQACCGTVSRKKILDSN